ncbi:MAG: YqeG family HAD IIIA-type phosphatase [Actinobacteria bacterium HGW-Actinobacteria-6]|jgi:hypothetical protein|nr:MAG: YqeG family HAD IIIA-type phosphatase [Actinobacteria bacterium HGW-Actinobacteria-6]
MPLLAPDRYLTDVHAIDLDALAADGIEALLLDIDNTILPRDTNSVPPELIEWVVGLSQRGFKVCLVSNNWHERVRIVATELGLDLVAKAIKPLPFAFWLATRKLGVRARRCAVIGDQLFTDVLGGKIVGAMTIMVLPLSETDLPHTLLLRRLEARIMRGARADGSQRIDRGVDPT